MRNIIKGTRKTPAIIVSGSPNIGTQQRTKDHLPYFKYHREALSSCFFLKGNQFLFINFVIYIPKYQLTIEPNILPKLAYRISKNCEYFSNKTRVINVISECPGSIVEDKNEEIKRLL